MTLDFSDKTIASNYVPKYDFRILRERVNKWRKALRSYVTRSELELVANRITMMSGFNSTLLNLRDDIAQLKAENRALNNEMKAIRKRHDKLRRLVRGGRNGNFKSNDFNGDIRVPYNCFYCTRLNHRG